MWVPPTQLLSARISSGVRPRLNRVNVFKFQSPLQKILLSLFGTFSSCRKAGALLSAPVAANATPLALRGGHGLRCFVFFFFFFFMLGGWCRRLE